MPSFKNKLTELTNSPQARKLTDKAKTLASDPKNKEKIENAKRKLSSRKGGGTGTGPGTGPGNV